MNDDQIVREVNKLGFRTRVSFIRSKHDRTKIVAKRGGARLTRKGLHRYLHHPIYAGVNNETWMLGQPIRCKFDGLVSIETFNRANRGKIAIIEEAGELKIQEFKEVRKARKSKNNPLYPYKRVVMCPGCNLPLYGSAARGRMGKYYPAYHCDKRKDGRDHYFRVPKPKFDDTIHKFIEGIQVAPQYKKLLVKAVVAEWKRRQQDLKRDNKSRELMIKELQTQAEMVANKIQFSSEVTLKYIEKDLIRIEAQIAELQADSTKVEAEKAMTTEAVTMYAWHFVEHPESLLLDQSDPFQKANYFGLLFERAPTYQDLLSAVNDGIPILQLSNLFLYSK